MTRKTDKADSAKREADQLPAPVEEPLPPDLEEAAAQAELPSFDNLGIGPKSVQALEMMAYEGLDYRVAAERAGIERRNFRRTFNLPQVRKAYMSVLSHLRANAGQRAFRRIDHLSQTAQSEHVRLEGSKWVAGVEGLAPVKRVEGKFDINHTFGGFDYGEDADHTDTVDGSAYEVETDDQSPSE